MKAATRSASNNQGWISVHRKLQHNFLWREPRIFSKLEAWLDILLTVQHSQKPQKVFFGTHILFCNYGESLKSLGTWAERWGWTKGKANRFLRLLEQEKMVVVKSEVVKSEKVTTRLSVCNFSSYQNRQNTGDTPNGIPSGIPKRRLPKDLPKDAEQQAAHQAGIDNKVLNNNVNINSPVFLIFDRWNQYRGQSVAKLRGGKKERLLWHGHKLKPDGTIAPDIRGAIEGALSKGYSADEICGAIDNYAKVLLGTRYYWSYVWSLPEFLTRGEERHKQAARKWFKFLPDNFIEERYLSASKGQNGDEEEYGLPPMRTPTKNEIESIQKLMGETVK